MVFRPSLLLTVAGFALAAAAPGSPASAAGRLAVERVKLENGLQLVLSHQPAVPIVAIACLVDGGARVDPPGKAGLAGLTGDLLSEGTKGRSSQDIARLVDAIGAQFSTGSSQDWIELDASVLARDFETGVDLVARSLREPTFPAEEVDRRRAEVLGELVAGDDDPHVVAQRAFRKAVFADGPYGHPVDGTPATVKAIKREDIVAFHRREMNPERTVCTMVGDVETARMREVASARLGDWKTAQAPPPQPTAQPTPGAAEQIVEMPVTQATIVLGQVGVARSNPDYFPILLMNHVLGGGGFTSRLMQKIRTEGGLAYGVSSSFGSTRLPGPFQIMLQTKLESVADAIRLVRAEVQKLHDEGATDAEIEAAKDYLTGSFPLRLDSTSKLASFLAQVQYFGLGDDYIERYADRVRSVTSEDVRRAAARYLQPDALVQVIVGPRAALEKKAAGSSSSPP
jgi:zinc protease